MDKDPAKEVRAYELGGFLRARFANLYNRRIQALATPCSGKRCTSWRSWRDDHGSSVRGVLGLLILFVSDGRVSLAGAGAVGRSTDPARDADAEPRCWARPALRERPVHPGTSTTSCTLAPGTSHFSGVSLPPDRLGDVSVRDLTFTYPSNATSSLAGINIDIRAGQVVALVGENGSGKTTLAKLLAGLYLPQDGRITWAGQDVATMEIARVRSRVAVLFQDFVHYFLSARENIAMGRWERADDDAGIRRAAACSGAQSLLEALPHGYDTYLGPQFFGGSDLSGGQWQRVALARAFFRDAELVILDEPTAALDPRAEAALFAAVRDLFAGRSVVLISHRFATVRLADHIYVLDQGRMVELTGTTNNLWPGNGLYAELFTLQASAFGLHEPPSPEPT